MNHLPMPGSEVTREEETLPLLVIHREMRRRLLKILMILSPNNLQYCMPSIYNLLIEICERALLRPLPFLAAAS